MNMDIMTSLISSMIFKNFPDIIRKNTLNRKRWLPLTGVRLSSKSRMSFFYNFSIPQDCCFALKRTIHMKKYMTCILSALLMIGLTFLVTEKVFSQAKSQENKTKTTDSVTTMPDGTSSYVRGITAGRAKSLVGGVAGLISLIIGWRAKAARSAAATGSRKTGAKLALVLGLIAIVLSVVHLSTSAGAVFGSGSGKAGAIVGLVLGLIGMTLGGLALHQKKI